MSHTNVVFTPMFYNKSPIFKQVHDSTINVVRTEVMSHNSQERMIQQSGVKNLVMVWFGNAVATDMKLKNKDDKPTKIV